MTADIIQLNPAQTTDEKATTLNERELVSIYALLAYTAHDRQVSEESVRQTVTSRFGVADVKQLPAKEFEDVIRFLVDLQINMLTN